MKVLQVYRDYFSVLPGGIERHVHDLAHGLRPDIESEVLTSSRTRASYTRLDGDVPVHFAAEHARFEGIPICPGFVRTMTRGRYDVIHLHSPNPTGEAAARLSRSRAARIATYHATTERGGRLRYVYEAALERFLESCRRVIVSSQRLVERTPLLSKLEEHRPDEIEIVPFGVDLDFFSPESTERSEALRAEWGPRPIVLFLGRLRYYKGLEYLIHALGGMGVQFVMIGDGIERGRIERLAQETLGDRLTYIPEMTDELITDAYRAADVFCLPSTSSAEAFGISAVEAMACGVPVITTEVGTATSVVNDDGVTGFVVPPRDPDALRAAVEKIVSDKELAGAMGDAARRRAAEHYDQRDMLKRIKEIYDDVISRGDKK